MEPASQTATIRRGRDAARALSALLFNADEGTRRLSHESRVKAVVIGDGVLGPPKMCPPAAGAARLA